MECLMVWINMKFSKFILVVTHQSAVECVNADSYDEMLRMLATCWLESATGFTVHLHDFRQLLLKRTITRRVCRWIKWNSSAQPDDWIWKEEVKWGIFMKRSLWGSYRKLIFQNSALICVCLMAKTSEKLFTTTFHLLLMDCSLSLFNKAGKKWLNNILIDF